MKMVLKNSYNLFELLFLFCIKIKSEFLVYCVTDDDGQLMMEMGWERDLNITFDGGDMVQVFRSMDEGPRPTSQCLAMPAQRWMRLT